MNKDFDVDFENWNLSQYDAKAGRRKNLNFRVFSRQFNAKFTGEFKGKKRLIWNQYVCWFHSNRGPKGQNLKFVRKACREGATSLAQPRKSPVSTKDSFPSAYASRFPRNLDFGGFRKTAKNMFPIFDASSRGTSVVWAEYKRLGRAAPSKAKLRPRKSDPSWPVPTESQVLNLARNIMTSQLTYARFGSVLSQAVRGASMRWGVGNTDKKTGARTGFSANQKLAWDEYKRRTGWVSQAKGARISPGVSPQPVFTGQATASSSQRSSLISQAANVIHQSPPGSVQSTAAQSILQVANDANLSSIQASALQRSLEGSSLEGVTL